MSRTGIPEGIALITGAASGIGRAVVLEFLAEDCKNLIIVDISRDALTETLQLALKIVPEAEIYPSVTDISDSTAVQHMVDAGVQKFGRIDFAVHCAGIVGPFAGCADTEEEEFDNAIGVNLKGTWIFARAVIRQMRKQEMRVMKNGLGTRGSIVNVGSILGLVGKPGLSAYNASKHGVHGITKSDACDYAKEGIRSNAIAPGFVRTNLVDEKKWEAIAPGVVDAPMGRFGLAEEMAAACVFLASDKASYITGAELPVDGGYVCM